MGQSLARIKRRINTVQSTRKITNSMKLISSVKLRKISKQVELEDYYHRAMARVLNDAIFTNKDNPDCAKFSTSFIEENPSATKTLYVLVTSTMGLCGGYNNNVIKEFKNHYKVGDEVLVIGEKAYLNLSKEKDLPIETRFIHLAQGFDLTKVAILRDYLIKKYLTGEYKEIDFVYTHYKNSISFVPEIAKILPLTVDPNERYTYSPIYEPNKKDVVDAVIKEYLKSMLYDRFYSAFLSEESSRRNTMDAADKNARDLVDKLRLEYNKARQSEITQEITEVINGSNAVK
jgi:F-type H+-transporting ATPase subunit gamma